MINLKALGKRMATQDNRSTMYPLFVVMVDKRIYMPHSYMWDYDGKERKDDSIQDLDLDDLCKNCRALYDDDRSEEMPDDCDDCDPDAFNWYKIEEEIDTQGGAFLTAKACDEHIKENRYHYHNPRSYGICAWRNPEMVAVMQHLIKLGGVEIPGHYK